MLLRLVTEFEFLTCIKSAGVKLNAVMTTFNYEAIKDLIRCPKTHAELAFTGDALVCCDPSARLRYPIVDGFPVLLVDEATELSLNDWAGIMKQVGRDPVTGSPTGTTPSKG